MGQVLRIAFGRITRNPLKGVVLLLSFALNAAVLAAVFAVYLSFSEYLTTNLLSPGTAIWLSTHSSADPGTTHKRAELYTSWIPGLKEAAGLKLASPFAHMIWSGIMVGTSTYLLTSGCLGVYPDYATICDLRMIAGSFFSDQEVADHAGVAVISENVAKAIWGSAGAAVGAQFDSVGGRFEFDRPRSYRVLGVFEEPSGLRQAFFQIPGAFVPYEYFTMGRIRDAGVMLLRAQSDDPSLARVRRRIRAAVEQLYRDGRMDFDPEIVMPIWEGSYADQSSNANTALLGRMRMVSTFFALMWVFSLLILSFGILALLSSDTSARLRETGLRRALGSTRLRVIGLIAGEAAAIVVAANVLGAGLTLAFVGPLLEAVKPLLAGGGPVEEVVLGSGPIWKAVVVSLVASVATGALGALYPGYVATRVSASDALREL